MKKNTHIYLASKAIELIRESISNTLDEKGKFLKGSKKSKERAAAKRLHEMLRFHKSQISQAAWAPDEVLMDQQPYHIFKLYRDDESFAVKKWEAKLKAKGKEEQLKDKFERNGVTYYRFSGGLPYRIDHLAQDIISMSKLREHNDRFSYEQIMYQYLLMSHYIADAHVPVHCDLRDDPPKKNDGNTKPKGKYLDDNAHGKLEGLWEEAVNPVAIREEIIVKSSASENEEDTEYTDCVTFNLYDCNKKDRIIKVPTISKNGLMKFMIDICIKGKDRSQLLYSVDTPKKRNDVLLEDMTREIFADCIAHLIAIWRYMWAYGRAD